MIFSIIILLLIGGIAYFHYVQGFFSAMLSAIIAVIAAVLAVSYQETIVRLLLKGIVADSANALVLCVLFAGIYIVLRLIFDTAVPGNVRVPLIIDKVGAAVMGIIAGIFATGVIALAAQMLPFGPTIGGYARYNLAGDRSVTVPSNLGRQDKDSFIYNEMTSDRFESADQHSLIIPVDDILIGTVQHLSDGGTLAGSRTLSAIHPDYPQELFGDRIGIQVGAKHTAMNLDNAQSVSVDSLYTVTSLPTADPEISRLRSDRKVEKTTTPGPGQVLLIARIMVRHSAADDTDQIFRFSPGSIRLVANSKDYYPVGIVDNANTLMSQKMDDFLFLNLKSADAGFDAAFIVDDSVVVADSTDSSKQKIATGTFVEVKRLADVGLSGQNVNAKAYEPSPSIGVMRKPLAMAALKLPPAAAPTAPVQPRPVVPSPTPSSETPEPAVPTIPQPSAVSSILDGSSAKLSTSIPDIGVNGVDEDAQHLAVVGGTISLRGGKFMLVNIDPTDTLEKLATADNKINELFAPSGMKAVQVKASQSGTSWSWAGDISSIKLLDANHSSYTPNGIYSVVDTGGKKGLFMRYDVGQPLKSITPPAGTPGDVIFIFLVPNGTQLTEPVNMKVE